MKIIAFCLTAGLWMASPALADDQHTQCIDSTVKNDEWARGGGE